MRTDKGVEVSFREIWPILALASALMAVPVGILVVGLLSEARKEARACIPGEPVETSYTAKDRNHVFQTYTETKTPCISQTADQVRRRYPETPRLRSIASDMGRYAGGGVALQFLIEQDVTLELSGDGLPPGASVRVFKDRIQLNPQTTAVSQTLSALQAALYMKGQMKDGLAYGKGEAFGPRFEPISAPISGDASTRPTPMPQALRPSSP